MLVEHRSGFVIYDVRSSLGQSLPPEAFATHSARPSLLQNNSHAPQQHASRRASAPRYASDPSEDVTAAQTDLDNFHKDMLVDPCFGFVMCAAPSSLGQSLPQEVFATHSTMSGFRPLSNSSYSAIKRLPSHSSVISEEL